MSRKRCLQDVQQAVEYFTKAAHTIKVRGNVELKLMLDTLDEASKTQGLSPEQIDALADTAASAKHGETISSRLVRFLVPSSVVPQSAVVNAISHMCTNIPSTNIQCMLMRWILLVYDYIDGKDKLHKLYGIIFHFMDNQTLMPHVCHLLYLLTRKEDIRLYRVQQLLELQSKLGPESYLIGLLSIYKLYAPNLVTIVLPKMKKLLFPVRDRVWWSVIKGVQQHNHPIESLDTTTTAADRLKMADSSQIRGAPSTKRRKVDPVPVVQPDPDSGVVMVTDTALTKLQNKEVSIVEIKDLKELLENPEKVKFPSQAGSALNNRLLQHVMSYTAHPVLASRFSYWLHDTLYDELLDNSVAEEDIPRIENLLAKIHQFSHFLQEGIPVVDKFLFRYLSLWNGDDFRSHILQLISCCRMYQFSELNEKLLEPLRKIYFCGSVYMKCHIVLCLTELLRNYVAIELKRYQNTGRGDNQYRLKENMTIFSEYTEMLNPVSTIQKLVDFISGICEMGLQIENRHALLMHITLQFMELVSRLPLDHGAQIVPVPKKRLFYTPLFCNNAMGPSRICQIMVNYKESLAESKKRIADGRHRGSDITSAVPLCNELIMCVSKTIWNGQAFSKISEGSCFNFYPLLLDPTLTEASNRFTLYMHQGFLGFALKFLKETQPEGNIGHPKGIRPQRDIYMEFLLREHVEGVSDFVSAFIKRRQSNQAMSVISQMASSTTTTDTYDLEGKNRSGEEER